MTISFYLKYRPQTFQELDNKSAKEELIKIFSAGKIPHAFLFSGPRGIGKTSAARIVAKAVNCPNAKSSGENYEPCNKCYICLSIINGTNIDVLEIDAASNRGIDDIKELREKIKLAPAQSKYKVYIIDEAHMLTTEAFNALLKTLEEPPPHALFILCTTDPEKLPKTIISRCQRINFKKATQKEIVEKLKKICQEEKVKFEEKGLEEIAKLADGSFRDANKILERVVLEGEVTEEKVKEMAGVLAEFNVEEFLKLLSLRKTKEALLWLTQACDQGANLRVLTENLLATLRQCLITRFGIGEDSSQIDLTVAEIQQLINLFSQAYFELKTAVIPQLPLEMAVIEWSEMGRGEEAEGRGSGSEDGEKVNEDKKMTEGKSEENLPSFQALQLTSSPELSPTISFESVLAKWPEILTKVKPLNHSVQAFLKATRPLAFKDGFLILEVFYKFHKDQLEKETSRRIFEKVATEVLGWPVKLKCSLSEVQRPIKPLTSESLTPAESTPVAEEKDDDIIKFAEEIFNKSGIQ